MNAMGARPDQPLLDAIGDQAAILDRAGVIVAENVVWALANAELGRKGSCLGHRYPIDCLDGAAGAVQAIADGVRDVLEGARTRFEVEHAFTVGDERRWFALTVTPLEGGGALVVQADITAQRRAERGLRAQGAILGLMAAGAPLEMLLREIAIFVEAQLHGTRVTIRLAEGGALSPAHVATPGLATEPARPAFTPCDMAADHGKLVVVEDFETDEAWVECRPTARADGFRAIWAIPVRSLRAPGASGAADRTPVLQRRPGLLGTVAVGSARPARPSAHALAVIDQAAHLVSIAVEHARDLKALSLSEERFRLLVDGIPDLAIFMVDLDHRIVTWNVTAERTYGYAASEVIGQPAAMLEVPASKAERPSVAPAAGGEGWQMRKGGERFYASIATSPLRNTDGTLRGHSHVVRDLTVRRRLEEQLWHAQKMEAVGRLAGGIAHDFNNLLTVVKANLDLLDGQIEGNPSLEASVSEIVAATDRATGLTRQLLAFSRKQVLDPVVLDLNQVVLSCERLLRRLIGEDVLLESKLAPRLPPVKADMGQLEQVLINLCVNARDAMPGGGHLTLETQALTDAHGTVVELSVTDTGIGMDEATRARIFEPFFTTKPHGQGTGLGLAVVYGIVEQTGGRIQVDSGVGEGACFRLTFPAHGGVEAVATETSSQVAVFRGRERLLLVEDEELVRRSLARALTRHGYEVVAADGAPAAMAELDRDTRVDLLVTDVVMPGMSGPKLVEAVRHRHPHMRVLFVSGYTDDLVPSVSDPFLQKPFTPAALLQKIRQVLDSH